MLTGARLIQNALSFRGEPYSTGPGRTSPTSGYKDCSGLIVAALARGGVVACGTVSTTLEACSTGGHCGYTARHSCVSLTDAKDIPGAAVAIWGTGSQGHIGLSMGDGRIVETPSAEGRQVGISPWGRNRWQEAFLLAGVDYTGGTPQEDDMGKPGMFVAKAGDSAVWFLWGNSRSHVRTREVLNVLALLGYAESTTVHILSASALDAIPVVADSGLGALPTGGGGAPLGTLKIDAHLVGTAAP